MQLKTKVMLILLSLFVAFGVLQYGAQKFIVYPSFIDLEQEQAKTNIDRVVEALKVRLNNLKTMNSDWANWDDAARFVTDHNPEFAASNLVDESQYNLVVNFIFFYDLNHKLVWGKVLDLESGEELEIEPYLIASKERILPRIPSYGDKEEGSKKPLTGLILIEGKPVLISARSILSSDNQGPTRGFLIFGRIMTEGIIQNLREQTRLDLNITPLTQEQKNQVQPSPYVISEIDANHLEISTYLPGIDGAPLLLLDAQLPREISRNGLSSILYAMASTILFSLLILFVVLLALQRTILKPVTLLHDVVRTRQSGDRLVRTGYKSDDELGQLAKAFDEMVDAIDQAEQKITSQRDKLLEINKQKNKFFSIIAHDLKGPFNSLLGFSSMLANNSKNFDRKKIEEYSQDVHTSATRVFRLLENLLEWSRVQMGNLKLAPKMINLKEVIEDNIALFAPTVKDKSLTLALNNLEQIDVYSDFHIVDTVIRNLVNNAIKFTPNGGNILIDVKRKDTWAEISVIDSGVGISQEKVFHLFNLDEKTSTPGTSGEVGTGLGLHLCKELLEKQGGQLVVKSQLGKGSAFSFTLPLQKP
ncbi:CHASE4 domain-containing protein [Kiloniella antarctica]|uniref:histidine kinase n=1 Tax=Kiloniella antarctica TaxID=1550907 RepID=A0ABW5BJV1_9PROT